MTVTFALFILTMVIAGAMWALVLHDIMTSQNQRLDQEASSSPEYENIPVKQTIPLGADRLPMEWFRYISSHETLDCDVLA